MLFQFYHLQRFYNIYSQKTTKIIVPPQTVHEFEYDLGVWTQAFNVGDSSFDKLYRHLCAIMH